MSYLYPFPYRDDGATYFTGIADRCWSIFLDSGPPEQRCGRFDIIAWQPYAQLRYSAGFAVLNGAQEPPRRFATSDPLALLDQLLQRCPDTTPPPEELPLLGGALGYFGYDLGRTLERLPNRLPPRAGLPELAFGLYDRVVVLDHQQQQGWVTAPQPLTTAQLRCLQQELLRPAAKSRTPFRRTGPVTVDLGIAEYSQAFQRVADYIRAGDCYQVNLARHFQVAVEGDPWEGYQRLRRLNPSPFAAYLKLPEGEVLSCSPERFLRLQGGRVMTQPIKGTLARAADPLEDQRCRETLRCSVKDRAENVMIVDLLRNDLGRCCRVGTVEVPTLFAVESFRSIHHLVSTIQGELATGKGALELVRACFPGGSITGAPKIRAMQIIEELESQRRGVYCGAIGYLGQDGGMDLNIAIRTLTHRDGVLEFSAGGGVVADSQAAAEFRETEQKVAALFDFLGWEPRV